MQCIRAGDRAESSRAFELFRRCARRAAAAIGLTPGFKGTPFPIIINEALEIGRRFSAPESINFLNGMLDAIAHSLLSQQEPPR